MEPGTVIADRFVIERRAGAGGMGAVYLARDRADGGAVALKLVPAVHDQERFAAESRALAELSHPAIVRYVAHGTTATGDGWLAMEWLEGEDLAARLLRAPLTVAESIALVSRAADALAAAHARGIVHRDVKPSNLFLPGKSVAALKVLDFGLVRVGGRALTRTGVMMGTPGYMAPEQAKGAKDVDARADVFSLGCVLFECLTGRPAFLGEHVLALLAKILLEDAPRPADTRPELPAELDALVVRMLAKDPADRPRDAAAVVRELGAIGPVAQLAGPATPSQPRLRALTAGEQRLVSVIVASGPERPALVDAVGATLAPADVTPALDRVRAAVALHGGRAEQLADGSIVIVITKDAAATDQAARAARCALALRAIVPRALALATGRALVDERWPVGDAVDRAATLLRAAAATPAQGIRIDDVTAGLLDGRFQLAGAAGDRGTSWLVGELADVDASRVLLGRRTTCVGRDRELAMLEAVWGEVVDEPVARVVLVTGPAGQGKSRVRQEFVERRRKAREKHAMLLGRGDPMRKGSPFGMIAPAIRRLVGILDGEPLPRRHEKLRARVAQHVPAADLPRVLAFLGELIDAPYDDDAHPQLAMARREPLVLGELMQRAFEDWLRAETSAGPLLIVLEDLHWGDLPSVNFVDGALRALADRPMCVLASARPEVYDEFPRLWSDRAPTKIELGQLSRRAATDLIRQVLGEGLADEAIAQVVDRAAGNAFYLEELIRAVAEGGRDSLPGSVLAMLQARLERLPAEARKLLRAGSVFGETFWIGGVAALVGARERAEIVDTLGWLASQEIILKKTQRRFPGEEEYAFRHALVRDAAYAMLTSADCALGHRLAADWLVQIGEGDVLALASHYERGGQPLRAAPFYRAAAHQAFEGNDLAAAIARARRGADCGATGELRGELRHIQAAAHQWRGEFADSVAAAREALMLLPEGSPAWAGSIGELAISASSLPAESGGVPELGARLAPWLDVSKISPAIAIAACRTALGLAIAAQYAIAEPLIAPVLESGLVERDPSVEHWYRSTRAMLMFFRGAQSDAILETRRAIVAATAAGDLRNACSLRGNVGFVLHQLGCYQESVAESVATVAEARSLGIRPTELVAEQNLAWALVGAGSIDDGIARLRVLCKEFHDLKDARLECGTHAYLSLALLRHGDVAAAEAEARLANTGDHPLSVIFGEATLAAALLAQPGREPEAFASAERAHLALERFGVTEEGEGIARLVWAEALHAIGRHDDARVAIVQARDRLLERTAPFSDEAQRRSFLERVPEHARTMQLARAWLT